MTNILLSIIALSEILRLLLTHWPTQRKSHFKQKLQGVEKMIWDLEFKVFKTREMREEIRKEYDYMKAKLDTIENQIKNWPKNKPEGDKARLEDDKVRINRDIERLEKQIKQLDVEIEGSKKCQEYPDGADGIVQQIDSLKELQTMLNDWIKMQ